MYKICTFECASLYLIYPYVHTYVLKCYYICYASSLNKPAVDITGNWNNGGRIMRSENENGKWNPKNNLSFCMHK